MLIKEAPGASSRSAANLVLEVALFGVRQEPGRRPHAQAWLGCGCCARYRRELLEALARAVARRLDEYCGSDGTSGCRCRDQHSAGYDPTF